MKGCLPQKADIHLFTFLESYKFRYLQVKEGKGTGLPGKASWGERQIMGG